ncbi:hypothetical protein DFH06DRAFT_1447214 [Mycena polygramma]|nr:hypothetical protein DFH06DRAFT_1447214 [Mycena polygramma]
MTYFSPPPQILRDKLRYAGIQDLFRWESSDNLVTTRPCNGLVVLVATDLTYAKPVLDAQHIFSPAFIASDSYANWPSHEDVPLDPTFSIKHGTWLVRYGGKQRQALVALIYAHAKVSPRPYLKKYLSGLEQLAGDDGARPISSHTGGGERGSTDTDSESVRFSASSRGSKIRSLWGLVQTGRVATRLSAPDP